MKVKNKSPFIFKNSVDETHTETIHFDLEQNAIKVISDDTLMFSKPVVITDNSEMWSGAKYDIPSMDITGYKGKLTADHRDLIQNVLGNVIGLKKVASRKVTIDGIKLAVKENPLADYAKRMMMAGFLTDFSIETIGPWPDDDGVFQNAKLVGLSLVVTGNNKQAHINKIAEQTMADAKANGLDTAMFAQALKLPLDNTKTISDNDIDMKFKKVTNSRGFAVTLKYKNSAGEEIETVLKAGQSIDVPDTDENKGTEDQVKDAKEPEAPKTTEAPVAPEAPKAPANQAAPTADVATIVKNAVEAAVKPLQEKIEAVEKNKFDNAVVEPTFTKVNSSKVTSDLNGMDWQMRHQEQVANAWMWLKAGNSEAARKLNEINKYNFEGLQKAGKIASHNPVTKNAITIADMGNFVISTELLTEIEGFRSNFKTLLGKLNFRDTLSLDMAWLTRSGDIDMEEVEFCDDDADGNLKPVKEYGAEISTSRLNEIAAVTPVCNAATRFLAADLLGDVAEGYRNDWDRKKAQLFIARLQQAVNDTGLVEHYNTAATGGSDLNAIKSIYRVGGKMQEDVMGGVFILSQASLWELRERQASLGVNNDSGFNIFTTDPESGPLMFGAPYIVVPNELLPKLGSNQTRTFIVGGVSIVITSALFYVDLNTFTGRTSGGLQYDLSTEAAYEVNGEVRSAYQRNELVLRGSGFRGGAVKDPNKVVGLEATNLS